MARRLIDILIEVEGEKDLQKVVNLWNEIANNKRSYPLTHLFFARRFISNLALNTDAPDIEKGKFFLFLNNKNQT